MVPLNNPQFENQRDTLCSDYYPICIFSALVSPAWRVNAAHSKNALTKQYKLKVLLF
jgi:hypothetical protein